jgi:hypothetical protein
MNGHTLILALLASAVPVSSAAREAPRVELLGGYSLARDDGQDTNGWDAGATLNLRGWLGLSADVTGHRESLGNTGRSRHSVLAGPRLSLRWGRFAPFAFALAGAFRTRSNLEFLSVSFAESDTVPGMALGGGLGVRLFGRWGVEVKADYAFVRSRGRTDSDPRAFGGLVVRFGALPHSQARPSDAAPAQPPPPQAGERDLET